MNKYYTVNASESFYDTMTGKLVQEFPNAYLLEFFRDNEALGGTQRVIFFKDQVNLKEE